MFYLTSFVKNIGIHPKDIKEKDIKISLINKIKELEEKISGNNGYVVCIVKFKQILKGSINNETGIIYYKINYDAITFKFIKDEILYTKPSFINEHGFFSEIASSLIFVSQWKFPDWKYDSEEKTWKNGDKCIKIGKNILIKIFASKINSNNIKLIANLVVKE